MSASETQRVGAGRRCVFCGGKPVTREHVVPQWISKLFHDDGPVDFSRTIHYARDEPRVHRWGGGAFDLTTKAVCADCNNGWMSRLEAEAQPVLRALIRNEERSLDAVEQHLVATWSVKTMLMFRLATGEKDTGELGREPFEHLARSLSPPPGEQVWIASYAGEGQWPIAFHYFGAGVGLANPSAEENAHCSSFAIGHFAAALAGNRHPDQPRAVQRHPRETQRVLWPTRGDPIAFPPPSTLSSDDDMRDFATPIDWRGA